MKAELIIKGGTVVTEKSVKAADILITEGKITSISSPGKLKTLTAGRIIQAEGKIVLPGIIDSHVHFQLKAGELLTSDNFLSGSEAAACGGVTTVIDYTAPRPGQPLFDGLKSRMRQAYGKMHVDYSFHCVIPSWKKLRNPVKQMEEMVNAGIPTFKMFMIYEDRGLLADDADLYQALEAAEKCKATICVHAESGKIIDLLVSRYRKQKELGIRAHSLSRPDFTEWEAVQRAITWAEITGGKLYLVHLSSGKSARLVSGARRRGVNVMGETCPQYLVLDDSVFNDRKNGHLFATCPQIKKREDSGLLWEELSSGGVSVAATDNCTFSRRRKNTWNGDITKIPFGMPGVQTLLPLIYTYGVAGKRISLQKITEVLCSNPAKIMGLYPRKGCLAPGSDADIAIINPGRKQKVDYKKLRHNCDWSPYQGRKLKGFPEFTILRGKVIAREGELERRECLGKFIPRKTGILV